jgi:acetyl/propionyl-CoA carboxylase alpha subunit
MIARTFRHGEHRIEVTARRDADRVHVSTPDGDHSFAWEELAPGEYLLRHDGLQRRCVVARAGDDRWIWIDGHVHHLRIATRADKRAAAPTHDLVAPMPGQVLKVLVAAGDSVRRDQTLVVLEAMKMQYELASPRDGVVRHVHTVAGAQVPSGVALVTLADDAPAAGANAEGAPADGAP